MRKGMLAGLLLGVLMLSAPAVFAACPGDDGVQGPGDDWQVSSGKGSYLGVEVNDITKERMAELKLREESGVEVTAVDGDAPAAKAGIKEHDVILSINGQRIESEEQLRRMIRETPSGRTINLGISREGQPLNITATLGSRKNAVWVGKINPKIKIAPMPPMPPQAFAFDMPEPPEVITITRGTRIGALVESVTPQLADYFGVKDGAGLLVRSVEKGSIAEGAGLKAGDVIVRIDKERVNDTGDWRRMLRNRTGAISIGVVRDKRDLNLTVTLPEKKDTGMNWYWDDNGDFPQVAELRGKIASLPQIDEQTQKAWEDARKQWEANRGEYEKSMAEARKEYDKAMKEQKKEMEKLQKELQKSFKTISFEED